MKIITIFSLHGGDEDALVPIVLVDLLVANDKRFFLLDLDERKDLIFHFVKNKSLSKESVVLIEKISDFKTVFYSTPRNGSSFKAGYISPLLRSTPSWLNGYNSLKAVFEGCNSCFDYIVINCPPIIDHSLLNAFVVSDVTVIVFNLKYFDIEGLMITHENMENIQNDFSLSSFHYLIVPLCEYDSDQISLLKKISFSSEVASDENEGYFI